MTFIILQTEKILIYYLYDIKAKFYKSCKESYTGIPSINSTLQHFANMAFSIIFYISFIFQKENYLQLITKYNNT